LGRGGSTPTVNADVPAAAVRATMRPMTPVLLAALLLFAAPSPARAPADALARLDARLRAGDWAALRAELERAEASTEGAPRAALVVALGRVAHESSLYHRHDPQAAEAAVMRALDAARSGGDARIRAVARLLEGRFRYWQGFADPPRWDEAQRIVQDAREQAAALRDARLEAEAVLYLGLVAQQQGRWDAARPLFMDALARAIKAGDFFLASFPERHLAYLSEEAKDLADAEARHRRSVTLRERSGATAFLPFARVALAGVLVERGKTAEAMGLLRKAAEEGSRSGSRRGEAMALLGLSGALAAGGDEKGAREAGARALAAARAYDDPELIAEAARAAEGTP
jgi:tetratricopeptide (TPR) repeat protein